MGALGPLMMGVVRRHSAILACPAHYGVAPIVACPVRWPECVLGCQLSDSKISFQVEKMLEFWKS